MARMRGFTLIELMVTIAVLAIILGIAVPGFTDQIRNNRSLTFGEEFAAALNLARSEAVKRSGFVSICASANDQASCGNDWTNGWLVFTDGAASDTAAAPVVSTVLRHWEAPANASITVTQNSTNTNFIRFTNVGTLARTGNALITSEIVGCTGNSARSITINRGGVARATNAACNDNP